MEVSEFWKSMGILEHTIKPGTLGHGTPAKQRKTPVSGRTTKHPGTTTEHQRKTSGTPRNNGTLYDEEQLHLNIDNNNNNNNNNNFAFYSRIK